MIEWLKLALYVFTAAFVLVGLGLLWIAPEFDDEEEDK